jgi:hypothetical protein
MTRNCNSFANLFEVSVVVYLTISQTCKLFNYNLMNQFF